MMYQRPPRRRRATLPLIIALVALLLIVGLGVFALVAFGPLKGVITPGGTATPTVSGTSIFNGSPSPGPAGPCTSNSPYGFTTIYADAGLVSVYKQLDVCWVRYQYHWDKIETSPGVYNWSAVDAAIATMNQAGIHVDFAIQSAPAFRKTVDCFGTPYLAGPAEMATFATLIATRYDGKHGHGTIDSFEIGNEEYDNHYVGSAAASEVCRSAITYGPILKAGYQAIKAANPEATVGMFGQWLQNIDHIRKFFTDLFSHGYGPYMDYLNFHFYNSGRDPSVSHNQVPSFNEWWQTIHSIATQYGFASKPIWVTEVGWATHPNQNESTAVTPQQQAQYMQYIMTQAIQSGVIQKVFWFTINYHMQADSIYPPNGPLPAYFTFQNIVRQRPLWR